MAYIYVENLKLAVFGNSVPKFGIDVPFWYFPQSAVIIDCEDVKEDVRYSVSGRPLSRYSITLLLYSPIEDEQVRKLLGLALLRDNYQEIDSEYWRVVPESSIAEIQKTVGMQEHGVEARQ